MHKYALRLSLLCGALSVSLPTLASSPLFLVGGGMKTCASQNLKHCDRSKIDRLQLAASRTSVKVGLTPERITRATLPALWAEPAKAKEGQLILNALAKELGTSPLDKAELQDGLKAGKAAAAWYYSLTDDQWFLLLDRLELPQTDRYGDRLTEQVWLDANKDPHTPAIIDALIAAAKAQRVQPSDAPVQVVVMTSSARDPFEAADFYRGAFSRPDTQVHWLPLDASVQAARRNNACGKLDDYRLITQGNSDRARIYPRMAANQQQLCMQPERGMDPLSKAEVLFINGGDQSLSWRALRHPDGAPTEELALIRKKFAAGQLVVGGTSAGAAVQGSPMIANGSNAYALLNRAQDAPPPRPDCDGSDACGGLPGDALVYNGLGGLGLLSEGTITDTHFSERGRQVRLTLLARQLGAQRAYGVDENTALVVHDEQLSVVGENGAWLLEFDGQSEAVNSHYLHQRDEARIGEQGLAVSLNNAMVDSHDRQDQPLVAGIDPRGDALRQLTTELCHSRQQQALGQIEAGEQRFGVLISQGENAQYGPGNGQQCSYRDLQWQIGAVTNE